MKKNYKRIMPAILAFVLMFSVIAMNAFAETTTTTTAAATEATTVSTTRAHTYELYQIFTGDFSAEKLSNLKWGKNGTGTQGDAVSAEIQTALQDVNKADISDSTKLATITKYVDLTSTPYRGEGNQPTKEASGNGYIYSGLEAGYYLIKDKNSTQYGKEGNYTLYVVKSTGGEVIFEPKGSIPTVSKKVKDGEGWYDVNEASIGEDVDYQITGTLSSRFDDYATYYYKFTDTLSKGLTYKEVHEKDATGTLYLKKDGTYTDIAPSEDTKATYASETDKYLADDANLKVYLANDDGTKVDVTKYFYKKATVNGDGTTTLVVAISDLKLLQNVKDSEQAIYNLNKDTDIVVEYTAVLNKDAVIKDANTNEVYVTYSNNPNDSGTPGTGTPPENPGDEPTTDKPTGETVKSKTETYTTELVLTKKNDNNEILQGAEFTLTGSGVKQVLVTELAFEKDESGSYYLLNDNTYTTEEPKSETESNYASTTDKYIKTTKIVLKGENQEETTVVGEVSEAGVVSFKGLGAGTYVLSETKTPAGYNTMSDVTLKISFDKETKLFSTNYDAYPYNSTNGKIESTVINHPGNSLPTTGGIGTTIFYVLGSILVLCALVLLIAKKRMHHEEN